MWNMDIDNYFLFDVNIHPSSDGEYIKIKSISIFHGHWTTKDLNVEPLSYLAVVEKSASILEKF